MQNKWNLLSLSLSLFLSSKKILCLRLLMHNSTFRPKLSTAHTHTHTYIYIHTNTRPLHEMEEKKFLSLSLSFSFCMCMCPSLFHPLFAAGSLPSNGSTAKRLTTHVSRSCFFLLAVILLNSTCIHCPLWVKVPKIFAWLAHSSICVGCM